ncbi:MAG: MFS transporter [Clostridia bacterium]|nr:MFS transporter [Clostridia bacterium]MDY6185272.1 MFS transporter [Eubacteriales bacterium]
MKKITNKVLWIFAVGQFGWSLLAGIISSWMVYYYTGENAVFGSSITGGTLFLGITLFGLITAVGRLFDAVTDPLIAGWSDASRFRGGRRIPFMKVIAIPFALITVGVFALPQTKSVVANDIILFVTLMLFYLFMTVYCTPYNALIAELGDTQKNRINVSTFISFTYIAGLSVAYLLPNIAGLFTAALGEANAVRLAIAILSAVAAIAMLVPSFFIKERDYIASEPVKTKAFSSLFKSFQNKQFRRFVYSDVIYFFAVTLFQTGLAFYITRLMHADDGNTFLLTVVMTVVSLCLYPVVNKLTPKFGKKIIIIIGFFAYAAVFLITSFCGEGIWWGYLIAVLAGVPMAILGILPQAVVADIAEADALTFGEQRSGMFFAARTFAMKLGQALSLLIFTSVTVSGSEFSYRMTAVIATVCCAVGAVLFFFYREKSVMGIITSAKKPTDEGEPKGESENTQ